jgi:hypothetical protein
VLVVLVALLALTAAPGVTAQEQPAGKRPCPSCGVAEHDAACYLTDESVKKEGGSKVGR